MFQNALGPKYKHVDRDYICNVLGQFIHTEEVKIDRISSEDINKLFVDKIKNLISYIKKSKYFYDENKRGQRNIHDAELIERCVVLTQRSTKGILPLLEISCKKKIIDKKTFFKQKKNLEKQSYQNKILNLNIADFDNKYDENRKREFLHLDDNEYADYLTGKALYYILRALKSVQDKDAPELIFEMADMASEAYFSFIEQYKGIENADKSASKKAEKDDEIKEIFNDLLDELGDSNSDKKKRLWNYEKNRLKTNSEIVDVVKNTYIEKNQKELNRSNKWIEVRIPRPQMNKIVEKTHV